MSVSIVRTVVDGDTIRVTVTRDVRYMFGGALGLINTTVSATAVARMDITQMKIRLAE